MSRPATTTDLRPLEPGDSAPWFRAPVLDGSSTYSFDTVAGRCVLMLFMPSAAAAEAEGALRLVEANRELFDDHNACFFGVTCEPADVSERRIRQQLPGIRFVLDFERRISTAYRAAAGDRFNPHWLLLDRALRVTGAFPIEAGDTALASLRAAIEADASGDSWAPVLQVPNVLPPELCAELIAGYEAAGGEPSGFMRQIDGKTRLVIDPRHKQRRDWEIANDTLRSRLAGCIERHLTVPVSRAFQFRATRIERYIVGCYEAGAGHFRPHRDNTTAGTAHRKFAVTINLNARDYDGGDLRFPEFGPRSYRAPTGGAIVFSCSLLHEATPVTRGRRYAFLPFLYDEEGARIREANNARLGDEVPAYRSGQAASAGTS